MTHRGEKIDRGSYKPGNVTLNYNWDEIPDDMLSQLPDELFNQVPNHGQPNEVSTSQWSCEVEHGLNEEDRDLTEEENGVTEEVGGLYDNFVQNEGEDGQLQQKPRYEHGSESDDSDYEFYDEENDVAIEDDHLFDDIVVLTPLEITNVEDDDILPTSFSQENIVLEEEYTMEADSILPFMQDNIVPEKNMENPVFMIGMLFATKDDVKEAIKEYSIKGGYETTIKKNDKSRMSAKCIPGCPWKIHASKNGEGTWQIKSLLNVHNCNRQYRNKHVTYKYIAKKWLDRFRDDPKLSLKTLKSTVRREIEVDVSHGQCTRGRQEAIKMIEGSYKEQYSRIWEYCAEVRQTNKYSSMFVRANPPYFQRLFVCLEACKNGFKKGCRPIIGVDGCHLKGAFGGQLLAAVGIDANDNMYPIAYAVVHGWNFVYDQQKGLDEAFKIVVPTANHRWCVTHLYGNFKKIHKGKALKDLLWSAARAPNHAEFQTKMMKLKKLNKPAYDSLVGKDPKRWARSRFSSRLKCDMLLNNLCETFNSWILTARDQSILTMLEMIREKPEAYVDKYYHKETYLKAYEPMIHPIKGSNMWPNCNQEPLLPPLVKKQPGRPKKTRRKDPEMEKDPNNPMQVVSRKGKTTTCTKCYGKGHNRRSCKNQPVDVPPNVYVDKRYAYPRPASVGEKRGQERGETSKQDSRQDKRTRKTPSVNLTSCPNIRPTASPNMPSASTNSGQGLYCNQNEASYIQVSYQPTITRVSRGGTFTTIPRQNNHSKTTISTSRVNMPQQKAGTLAPKFGTFITPTPKNFSKTSTSTSKFGLPPMPSSSTGQGSAPIWRPPRMTPLQKM
ncbi:hypothetical protein M0R45_010828 [Rubus argutus]|uniref:Transposase MuDR plant domain-containing protein n=1 Tax=Rubus argutus TaxID=59490 RepID=A0AAW1Y9B5_RUBAR